MFVEPKGIRMCPSRPARGPSGHVRAQITALAGGMCAVLSHKERAWASVTFEGARHTVSLQFAGQDAIEHGERLIAALPDHEFAIPDFLVAEATVTSAEHTLVPGPGLTVTCELLLLRDA